jgi:hypothetical protein
LAQAGSEDTDRDDEEPAVRAGLGDDMGPLALKRCAFDDVLDISGRLITLPLDDLAREDDVLGVEDGEVVIVKFVRGVG